MTTKKMIRLAKASGEFCSIGAGVVTIVLSVVGALVALPVFVGFIAAAAIGLLCAYIGGRHEARLIKREEQHKKKVALVAEHRNDNLLAIKEDLDEIRKTLDLHAGDHAQLSKAKTQLNHVHQRITDLHTKKRSSVFFHHNSKTASVIEFSGSGVKQETLASNDASYKAASSPKLQLRPQR